MESKIPSFSEQLKYFEEQILLSAGDTTPLGKERTERLQRYRGMVLEVMNAK